MLPYLSAMLERIKQLFAGYEADPATSRDMDPAFAAAALMIEAASIDGEVSAKERETIAALLVRGFDVDPGAADGIVAAAEKRMTDAQQLHPFARTIRDNLSGRERVSLVEAIWEVIYADGRAHDYETNLMRRLGGLIYVSDVAIGAARKRVLDRGRPAIMQRRGTTEDRFG